MDKLYDAAKAAEALGIAEALGYLYHADGKPCIVSYGWCFQHMCRAASAVSRG